jgi:HlyD family secretion protein
MTDMAIPAHTPDRSPGEQHRRIAAQLNLDDSPRHALTIGVVVAVLFFVVGLGWAAFARLDSAATGEGQVAIAGNRQTVQHREGGIVRTIAVRDGQHVAAGDILFRLDGGEVEAGERALAASVIDLQAQRARLEADVRGGAIQWPASFAAATGDDRRLVDRARALQESQRQARIAALSAGDAVLARQAADVGRQGSGYAAQSQAAARQRRSLQQQLESTRALADQGYVSRNQVRAIERSIDQLAGSDADYAARSAASREQVGQVRAQEVQARRRYVEDSATLLRDTQFQLNETMPKWVAARDQLARTVIRAPVGGTVVGLKVFSAGGVILPGQPILDIVPDAAPLVVRASFAPTDIDGVVAGREAEVKFLSLHERDLPIMIGTVRTVSADALRDEASGRSYFSADIVVPHDQIARISAVRSGDTGIRAGVPVTVSVKLRSRTALQYLFDPLTEAFRRSFHER